MSHEVSESTLPAYKDYSLVIRMIYACCKATMNACNILIHTHSDLCVILGALDSSSTSW